MLFFFYIFLSRYHRRLRHHGRNLHVVVSFWKWQAINFMRAMRCNNKCEWWICEGEGEVAKDSSKLSWESMNETQLPHDQAIQPSIQNEREPSVDFCRCLMVFYSRDQPTGNQWKWSKAMMMVTFRKIAVGNIQLAYLCHFNLKQKI